MSSFLENAVVLPAPSDSIDKAPKQFDETDFEFLVAGQSFRLSIANQTAPCGFIEKNKAEKILGFVSQPTA